MNQCGSNLSDADLSNYFGEIPHAELMKSVARRVSDGRMLGLLKAWLEMPVVEEDGEGGVPVPTKSTTDPGRSSSGRSAKGGVTSPACQQSRPGLAKGEWRSPQPGHALLLVCSPVSDELPHFPAQPPRPPADRGRLMSFQHLQRGLVAGVVICH